MRSIGIVAMAGATAVSVAVTAQNPSAPTVFRANVDVIQIDVSVLDDRRRPVRGLTAADFTVLEDGKPRPVVAFSPVDLPSAPAPRPAAAWTRDVAPDVATNEVPDEGRLVIIAFDWSIRFQDSTLARKIALAAIDDLGPADQAAIVYTSGFSTSGVPQNFTADRERLIAAVNQPMAFAMQGYDVVTERVGGYINANGVMLEDPSGYASGDCHCRACAMEAMTRVADAVRGAQGRRKVMLFIGTHFRGYEAALQGPRGTSRGTLPPPSLPMPRFLIPDNAGPGTCSQPLRDARRKMELAAGLANLTIHVLDPVGLETALNSPLGGQSADTMLTRQEGLHIPSQLTGGRTVLNTNAPEDAVPAILQESQSYYLIGFTAGDKVRGNQLRRIEVKVARPGVEVRARSGYFGNEEGVTQAARTPTSSLLTSIEGTLPRKEIPLTLAASPFAMPGNPKAAVVLILRGEASALPSAPRSLGAIAPSNQMRIAIAALDPKGRVVASREQTAEVSTTGGGQGDQSYELFSRLDLLPGRYEIRAGVELESQVRGSVFTFVDVPDFLKAPLTLTGVALDVRPALRSASTSLFDDLLPVRPTSRRVFQATDRVTGFARLHESGPSAAATMLARVVDVAGRVVFERVDTIGADQFTATHAADYTLDLPIDRMAVGEYLLALQASTADHEFRRNVRFTIR